MTEKLWLEDTQPIHKPAESDLPAKPVRQAVLKTSRRNLWERFLILLAVLASVSVLIVFLVGRINVLILGIDRSPGNSAIGRSDSMILATVNPVRGYVGMLSIPRDLWVSIPGEGANRINTAHFFAEAEAPGRGPVAAVDVVSQNFGIDLEYFIRFQFDSFQDIIDAMGGVPLSLDEPAGGLPAGEHVLGGEAALAFVRYRNGSDDFFRMAHGQQFIRALVKRTISPGAWTRLPVIAVAVIQGVDTNLPIWTWPTFGWAMLFSSPEDIDGRLISREMVQGFTTPEGAQVLAPDWTMINPVLLEMFGQ